MFLEIQDSSFLCVCKLFPNSAVENLTDFTVCLLYCHNPTNNPKRLKTTFVGVVLLSVRNNHTKPNNHHVIAFKAVQGNRGSWFLVCYLIFTQLEDIWKTTSIFLKMEDDLHFFSNGRQPQIFQREDDLNFFQMKNELICFQMKYDLNVIQLKDNLNILANGRHPQKKIMQTN